MKIVKLLPSIAILLLLSPNQGNAVTTKLDCGAENGSGHIEITLDDLAGTVSVYYPRSESTEYFFATFNQNEVLFHHNPSQTNVGILTGNYSINRITLRYHYVYFINGAPGGEVWFQCKIAPKQSRRQF